MKKRSSFKLLKNVATRVNAVTAEDQKIRQTEDAIANAISAAIDAGREKLRALGFNDVEIGRELVAIVGGIYDELADGDQNE